MTSRKSGFADSLEASVDRYVRNVDAVVMTVISQPGRQKRKSISSDLESAKPLIHTERFLMSLCGVPHNILANVYTQSFDRL